MTKAGAFRFDPAQGVALPLLLVVLVVLVYWPGRNGGFVFDDMPNIVNNLQLHVTTSAWADWVSAIFSSPSSSLQRPVAMLSFAINHYFTGLDPVPMKLTNIAIHACNSLLALALARALVRAWASATNADASGTGRWAAPFTAAAWALHPINLMAVLFVVQRMESLSHLFVFGGLLLYVQGRERQLRGEGGWTPIFAGLVLCGGLGALAKESAVLLPLYAFCMELCLFRFGAAQAAVRVRLKWLYALGLVLPAILGVAWLLPDSLAPGAFSGRAFDLRERLLTEFRVVLDYLSWTIRPDLGRLGLYHDDYPISRGLLAPPSTLFAMAGVALLAGLAWWLRSRRPLAALGILWFFAAQALTATFIPLELVFEHRNYFASFGVCLLLADLLLLAPTRRAWRMGGAAIAAALVLLYASGTALRANEWNHPVRFVQSEVAKHPGSPRATYELARMLVIATNYDPQSPHFAGAMAAVEAARKVPGSGILPEQAGLLLAARSGRTPRDAWWDSAARKLREQPVGAQETQAMAALVDCANIGECRFPADRMTGLFVAAMSQGEHPEILNLYGAYALRSLRNPPMALSLWTEAVRASPSVPQYRVNLARLLISLGQLEEARVQIAALRAIGRLGQNESRAVVLDGILREAESKRAGAVPQ